MRLFTAIDLPETILYQIGRLLDELRPHADVRWSRAENLHVTTRFVGEWPDQRLAELESALRRVAPRAPIPIALRGLGWFPNPHSPRVFWAAVHAPPELARLARDTDAVLEPLGLKPEGRDFRPHLTLARIEQPAQLGALRRAIAAMPEVDLGRFEAERFYLYSSQLGRGGSKYTRLAEFPLGGQAAKP